MAANYSLVDEDGNEVAQFDGNDMRVLHGACEHAVINAPDAVTSEYRNMADLVGDLL